MRRRTKPKKRRKTMSYTCIYKAQSMKLLRFEEPNEHGAKNEVSKQVLYCELHFSYTSLIHLNEVPEVIQSTFTITTKNPDIISKYEVGGVYSELPTKI
jgi:hypothetical protein